ncbi:hypothetical protein HG536_0A02040 [Torulaspora globosa]|uniref:Uncharacterized protein n=1 Tax=Torulaspora globosa TaxID=48254 RepID=A0A7G3ZA51_9SACH|nr:uncharacterized protein HG536_0A02040 [Torulaspora globosa]QLL30387.1 hypothetical protein HG536_0A02040 [Torulaspora globosa]
MSIQSNVIGLCTVAFVLLVPPLAWHSQNKNVPAIVLISWLIVMNLSYIVAACVWSGEDFASRWSGKGWCDVVVKLQVGANVGISCAVGNIVNNLHSVLKADSVLPEAGSWRKIGRDLAVCLVPPVVIMGLSYLVQMYRFGVTRYYGCLNLLSPTWVTTVLYTMWPFVASTVAAVYASMVLYIFYRKRKDVKDILHCTNSKLNLTRFARLLIFCCLIILVMFPLSIYALVEDVKSFNGHYSYKETHSSALWNVIPKIDAGGRLLTVWIYVLMSYLVFFIFGLGADALHMYANFLRSIKLGFIVDALGRLIEKSKDRKIAKLLGKISSSEYKDEFFSDSSMEKSDGNYSSDSPQSQAHFVVDYRTPYESSKKSRNKRGIRIGFEKTTTSDVEEGTDGFNPFLSQKLSEEDSTSLDGLSQLSFGRTNTENYDLEKNGGIVMYQPRTCDSGSSSDDYKTVSYTTSPNSK